MHVSSLDCKTAYASGIRKQKILLLNNSLSEQPMFPVRCNLYDAGYGGLILIQKRSTDSKLEFSRDWSDYKAGFGDLKSSFWIGLDKLHTLAAPGRGAILVITIKVNRNIMIHANYSTFEVAGEANNYRLTIGGYKGRAGDSLSDLNGASFSTHDQPNNQSLQICGQLLGGWWYKDCRQNLNSEHPNKNGDAMYQMMWNNLNINFSRMMIKYSY